MDRRALRKTVPFVSKSTILDDAHVLLIDNFEIPIASPSTPRIVRKLSNGLALDRDKMVSAAAAVTYIADQIDCCLEFIYSSPYWSELRKEPSGADARVFVSEFFHFVRASSFHMGAAQTDILSDSGILKHIAGHTIEEDGHEHFYVNALKAMGLSERVVYDMRPLPTTIELLYVVRALAQMCPITALACSAFMEGTTSNSARVKEWHELMASSGRLPAKSARSIYQHVVEDEMAGHAESWKSALLREQFVAPQALCDALNSIAILAEMIRRWFDSLLSGLSNVGIRIGIEKSGAAHPRTSAAPTLEFSVQKYCNTVVHPRILNHVVHQRQQTAPATEEVVSDYFFPPAADAASGETSVSSALKSWSIAYREHNLWSEMTPTSSADFSPGLVHELWFLCRSLNRSIGIAASTTASNVLRRSFLQNWSTLRELESDFAGIVKHLSNSTPAGNRPLPSTVALSGAMIDLAHSDVRGYAIALHFLDGLVRLGCHHVSAAAPSRPSTVDLQPHRERLKQIADKGFCDANMLNLRERMDTDTASACGPIVNFAWSFLDGVRTSYREGCTMALSRVGWHVR